MLLTQTFVRERFQASQAARAHASVIERVTLRILSLSQDSDSGYLSLLSGWHCIRCAARRHSMLGDGHGLMVRGHCYMPELVFVKVPACAP